jgi:oxygen-independent coproporphyrinogen III oxidase
MMDVERAPVHRDATLSLQHYLAQGYCAYTYAYPHKSAYRRFEQPVPLTQLWQPESRQDLTLYVHIPFCHYRCGFCNLFALGAPKAALVQDFLISLERQIKATAQALGAHRITRMAIGGGTPSYLQVAQFEELMACLHRHFNLTAPGSCFGIEVAPDSATPERLRSYKNAGVTRVSMGVQSFLDHEMDALARPRQREAVLSAVQCARELAFATLNLDLIYGIAGQTEQSFTSSLDSVLALNPDELYLYPLYVRQLTGLAKAARTQGLQQRAALYAAGSARLGAAGYLQSSMRMFRKTGTAHEPAFACQTLGTIGLGAGARSYTRGLHYSEEYAVSRGASQAILHAYNARTEAEFASARFGFVLDDSEQRRRYVLQSLLMWPGLDLDAYHATFGRSAIDDFPELQSLLALSLAQNNSQHVALTESGMAQADAIGPWLYSAAVRSQSEAYDWR